MSIREGVRAAGTATFPAPRGRNHALLDALALDLHHPGVSPADAIPIDALIFGGGIAGLWTLDALRRKNPGWNALLVESDRLGAGQTAASQGIIHGGLKYTLDGLLGGAAGAIREMPGRWRDCLAGGGPPNLANARVRADFCHIWRTGTLMSRLGAVGARVGLQVKPLRLDRTEWPVALAGCPGQVYRLDEQVIDPCSVLAALFEANREQVLKIDDFDLVDRGAPSDVAASDDADPAPSAAAERPGAGRRRRVTLRCAGRTATVAPAVVVLCAGAGNEGLRARFGLKPDAMQRRPLHMTLARGPLPELNGHCVDGARTRITVTSAADAAARVVWQIGGQIAELGVDMSERELIAHAQREIAACIPKLDLAGVELATHRIDRAEAATSGGRRPDDVACAFEGGVITAWPTKLALAPRLADEIVRIGSPVFLRLAIPAARPDVVGQMLGVFADWPRPQVAPPPWEDERAWTAALPAPAGRRRSPRAHDSGADAAPRRALGRCGLRVSPIGFGAFKIGRNEGVKYAQAYALPDDDAVERLLNETLDAGVTYFDTAPAYGLSEERIGRFLAHRKREFVLSTKVGETFEAGRSTYDFSAAAVRASIDRSRRRLKLDALDLVFVHAPREDLAVLERTDVVETLLELRAAGVTRAIGFSGKTVAAARRALDWADVLMVEYHAGERSHGEVIRAARASGVGVVVKKGLASGRLAAAEAIRFVLSEPGVGSLVIGSLSAAHMRANVRFAHEAPRAR